MIEEELEIRRVLVAERRSVGLILGDVGEIVEDPQMTFVELVDRGFESEIASRDLQSLDDIPRSREENAPAVFDERRAPHSLAGEICLIRFGVNRGSVRRQIRENF